MNAIEAHRFAMHNRAQVLRSSSCGCFYCLETYAPSEIGEWCDEGKTALCPRCSVDSVLGSDSGIPLTREFLSEMKDHWFERRS
jgi:hypothetical protein